MSESLSRLAERIAEELAAKDWRSGNPATSDPGAGPPPRFKNTVATSDSPDHSIAGGTICTPKGDGSAGGQGTNGAAMPPPGVRYVRAPARIADFIDHTALKAETTRAEIDQLCDEAREHHFAAVCVNPSWVSRCRERLDGSGVSVATVVGFPLGAGTSSVKAFETARAVADGADEIDMVAPVGAIKSGDWRGVADDIGAVVQAAGGRIVKVIIESAALSPVEIIKACAVAKERGAQYVKTSTGFHPAGGASAEAVALMRLVVGDDLGVKASGGVRDCASALKMIASGATRIGTSSGVSMAKCLGAGPLPLADLLSLSESHGGSCGTGSCTAEAAGTSTY